MSVELLQTLSLVSYIMSGVFLIVSIVLFFFLNVRKLIGDISGANARKAIESIRQQNESSGDKAYKPSPVNAARGKLTDKISPSGRLQHRTGGMGGSPGTEKFATVELVQAAEETTLLANPSEETTILSAEYPQSGETTVLSQFEEQQVVQQAAEEGYGSFTIDVEMSFTGSSEIIE